MSFDQPDGLGARGRFPNIAIVGKMCTGKSSLGDCVRERAPRDAYVKLSFATRIKQLAVELFDMPPGSKDRDLLCYIGAAMRQRDPNVWIRALVRSVQDYNARGIAVIVDDCRFQNELITLRQMGFYVIKCEAAASVQLNRLKQVYKRNWAEHAAKLKSPSECDLDAVAHSAYDYIADESEAVEDHADGVMAVLSNYWGSPVQHALLCAEVEL